jgi:fimbrial isopeptide formation D2 family protein
LKKETYFDGLYWRTKTIKVHDEKLGCNSIVKSWDPNEMLGPVGYGDENYIGKTQTINYRITFENKAEATAPAYRIRISDVLDENVFDLSTVRFNGTSHDNAGFGWKINREGNKLTWDIEGIELPPNVNAPEGEGYVDFSVDLKPGLKSNTKIKNKATIIFDYNEPIETNEYVNTLDLNAPEAITDEAILKDGKVVIKCNGSDGESGVGYYDYYASYKKGSYQYIGCSDEEFEFVIPEGTDASDYAFMAMAVDNVGNVQEEPTAAVAVTGIHNIPYEMNSEGGIYTLEGMKVGNGKSTESLPTGVYILRDGKSTKKVIIK